MAKSKGKIELQVSIGLVFCYLKLILFESGFRASWNEISKVLQICAINFPGRLIEFSKVKLSLR